VGGGGVLPQPGSFTGWPGSSTSQKHCSSEKNGSVAQQYGIKVLNKKGGGTVSPV
jgi:hypothetical protein